MKHNNYGEQVLGEQVLVWYGQQTILENGGWRNLEKSEQQKP